MAKSKVKDLLPEVTRNKKYEKKQRFIEKKKLKELRREDPRAAEKLEKAKLKKALAAKKDKQALASTKGEQKQQTKSGSGTSTSTDKKPKKKERRPKTVVANVPTGRETYTKKVARELVKEKKLRDKELKKAASRRANNHKDALPANGNRPETSSGRQENSSDAHELDHVLLTRTIRGQGVAGSSHDDDVSVRKDPFLYPSDLAFYEDYAEKQQRQNTDEESLLQSAHQYFKKVGQKERQLNLAAAAYLREMKEVNRRGGDKDGFQYVLPKNIKGVVKMMRENDYHRRRLAAPSSSSAEEQPWIDSDTLQATFGGDGVEETSDKPMRRKRKRRNTYSDFYQFQVSKRWTKNAESFLNRGRAHKSLFEAKKRQRSIRKL